MLKDKKILHIINDLNVGGAEMMLLKLLKNSKNSIFKPAVICMTSGDRIKYEIIDMGIEVIELKLNKNLFAFFILPFTLYNFFKKFNPDIIQGWMYHGNFLSIICKYFFSKKSKVVFNIRQTLYDINNEKFFTKFIIRLNSYYSYKNSVSKIIYNSKKSSLQHINYGFNSNKTILIYNAFNTKLYKPDIERKNYLHEKYNLYQKFIIGNISRFHPMKGHDILIKAAIKILKNNKNFHFFLYGKNINYENKKLFNLFKKFEFKHNIHLLGEIDDVHKIIPFFDLSIIPSKWGEGFSNFLGESMSTGVPCIATNIGDSAFVVDDAGIIIEPNNIDSLVDAILKFYQFSSKKKYTMSLNARKIIVSNYNYDLIFSEYIDLYNNLI